MATPNTLTGKLNMSAPYLLTKEKVIEVQKKWADGIVMIGLAFTRNQDYLEVAKKLIDELYAFDVSPVLFKPTLASNQQFRCDKESALSYFTATNGVCPEDHGFALKPWKEVRFENANVIIHGDTSFAMGNYYFTDNDDQTQKVEYTFGYILDKDGQVRINLHHSSLPYRLKKKSD
ncbi:MAG: hypothetical protein HRU09_11015 [Oligoflexales bacterium]|nr:hypothetical protein [Oligoflexales bacterium]